MVNNTINPIQVQQLATQTLTNNKATASNGVNFKDLLMQAMENVNMEQKKAERISELFAAGEIDDLHQVMIAQSKADVTLNFAVEVKNKLIESYKEIMRLQL